MKSNTTTNTELFEYVPVPRALATLAIPTIVSQLITLIYNLADAYFVGRTGNAYMIAAVSLIYPVFSMTAALSNPFGVGGGSLISRLLGIRQEEQARKICVFSIYAAVCISVFFSLLCFLFLSPLLQILGASTMAMEYARQYMIIVVIYGTLPTVLSNTIAHLVGSTGYAKFASVGLSMGAVLNILLNPLFMFVLLPPGQEIVGAALATMLSNTVSTVYFLCVIAVLQKNLFYAYRPKTACPTGKILE